MIYVDEFYTDPYQDMYVDYGDYDDGEPSMFYNEDSIYEAARDEREMRRWHD